MDDDSPIIRPPDDWVQRFTASSEQARRRVGLQDVRNRAIKDPYWLIRNYLKIATKRRQDQTLRWNRSQAQLWDKVEERRLLGKAIRFIILKSRQVGISTQWCGYAFARWWAERNFNALVIAHLKQVTSNLFKKHRKFYVELPPAMRIPLERSNKQELIMDMAYGGSQLFLATAGSPHEARSQTLHFVHGSEAAFYAELFELKEALEASVPDDDDTAIIWESTAFGAGTPFHQLWQSGLDGESIYESIFLEWFTDPDCNITAFENDRVREMWLERVYSKAPFLKDRKEHYGLTAEQICWYFQTCINKYKGEWVRMQQEFPCEPDEAFLASGMTVIPTMVIQAYQDKVADGTLYNVLHDWSADPDTWREDKYLERDKQTYFEVWEKPRPNRHYLVSVDAASGHGADYSCAMVFDIATQNLVAELHGKIPPKQLAEFCMKIGTAYNHAVLCIETNGLGMSVLSHVEDKYAYIYRQRTRGLIEGVRMSNKLGWHMSEDLRWAIMANLRAQMMDRLDPDANPQFFMRSKPLLSELKTFIQPPSGNMKPQAERGCHDDRVMAFAIGIYACLEEIVMRPDIIPLALTPVRRDNGMEFLDVEAFESMINDPLWDGINPYTTSADNLISGPFAPVHLTEDEYDEAGGWELIA